MTSGSGLFAQVMYAAETTVGLPVTPTVALPFVSESLDMNIARIVDDSIIAGRATLDSSQWAPGNVSVTGDVQHKLYPAGAGLLMQYLFLSKVVTTGVGPYVHTYTPVAGISVGKSLTVQKGIPGVGAGAVQPFTIDGAKVAQGQIACKAGEFATLGLTFLGIAGQIGSRQVSDGVSTSASPTVTSATAAFTNADIGKTITSGTTAIPAGSKIGAVNSGTSVSIVSATTGLPVNCTASTTSNTFTIGMPLATVSYPSPLVKPFTYVQGAVTIGGTAVFVKEITLGFDNLLDDSRRGLGRAVIKEALEKDLRNFSGTITMEFEDTTQYDRFVSGSEFALVLSFTSGTQTLVITMNVRFDGDTPKIGDRGLVDQPLQFVVVGASTDASGITAVLTNGDATP